MGLTISYDEDGVKAEITVERATVLRGLLRTQLTDEALKGAQSEENPLIRTARWMQYPALRAGTTKGWIVMSDDGAEIDATLIEFEQFLGLPEPLATRWLACVFELNGHWLYQPPAPEDEEGNE